MSYLKVTSMQSNGCSSLSNRGEAPSSGLLGMYMSAVPLRIKPLCQLLSGRYRPNLVHYTYYIEA